MVQVISFYKVSIPLLLILNCGKEIEGQVEIIVTLTKAMIISKLRCLYHLRKPRVPSQTTIAYSAYKKELTKARTRVHKESVEYLNQIEDNYLRQHKQAMKKQHFENQCSFRKQIFTDAYRLLQNQIKWGKEDERFSAALNKYLHDQDVRKINRSRILKIMEHESNHYWFNTENVDTRLKESTIFPEWIASSEYYYRLFAEAMAYELGDFHELHMVTSNEEIIRQKNKYLIPLYLTLRNKISEYLRDPLGELEKKKSYQLNLIKNNKKLYENTKKEYQEKIDQLRKEKESESKEDLIKRKIKDIISIFKTWKEYTNILSLTSAQVINNQGEHKAEQWIYNRQIEVLKDLKKQKGEDFVDSIEEDTEEVEMTFEEYLAKIKQEKQQASTNSSESAAMEQLDSLLSQIDSIEEQEPSKNVELDLSGVVERQTVEGLKLQTSDELNPMFLNPNETTASVQILKQQFKNDPELVKLLNKLGELDVKYPKLFQEIWKSCSH